MSHSLRQCELDQVQRVYSQPAHAGTPRAYGSNTSIGNESYQGYTSSISDTGPVKKKVVLDGLFVFIAKISVFGDNLND